MKPAIFFGVVASNWTNGWTVLAVTGENDDCVFGREDGKPTRRAHRDVLARFPTADLAHEAIGRANAVDAAHVPAIKAAEKALRDAVSARDIARRAAMTQNAPPASNGPLRYACHKPC